MIEILLYIINGCIIIIKELRGVMMAKIKKTNAMRILDKNKVHYKVYHYETKDGKIDGTSVAEKMGQDPSTVYKTLVTQGNSKEFYVFVIPVVEELDLKKAAIAAKEKRVEMIPVKNIFNSTGYIRGGCSPIGMKKLYKTYLDSGVNELTSIIISGGKIGTQIELSVTELQKLINGQIKGLIK